MNDELARTVPDIVVEIKLGRSANADTGNCVVTDSPPFEAIQELLKESRPLRRPNRNKPLDNRKSS
jgi:hypothetical protein